MEAFSDLWKEQMTLTAQDPFDILALNRKRTHRNDIVREDFGFIVDKILRKAVIHRKNLTQMIFSKGQWI